MRPLVIGLLVLVVAAYSNMAIIESLDDEQNLMYLMEESKIVDKRQTEKDSLESFTTFLEEKLTQQSQALEHLVKRVDESGDMVKKLVENLSKGIEKPKLPAKATAEELPKSSRRSFGGNPVLIPSQKPDDDKVNPWCPMALLCEKTVDPVCGFDDEFGYGKFEDLCHMLRVNCYWKYNFAMVLSCRPTL